MMMTRSLARIAVAVLATGFTANNLPAQTPADDAGFASLYRSGQSAMAAGRFDEARVTFEHLEKLDPTVAEVHATLGVLDYKLGNFDRAVEEIRAARKLKPELRGLDALLALSLAETGRYSEALSGLEKGFKQTADSEVRRMCGLQLLRVYPVMQRDSDAVETAIALNRYFPDDPEVLYHTGRIYGNQAYVVMMRLHDKAPNSIWMFQAQGEANESEKNYDAALASFKKVLDMDPQRPGIHYRLGRVYLARFGDQQKTEDRTAAAHEFATELEIDPENGNAGYELGVMAAEKGSFEEAQKRFEDVLTRFPDFEDALVALGGCYLQLSKPDAAVSPLEKATKVSPNDEVAWYRLARAERAVGNADAATKSMAMFRKVHSEVLAGLHVQNLAEEVTPQKLDAEAKTQ